MHKIKINKYNVALFFLTIALFLILFIFFYFVIFSFLNVLYEFSLVPIEVVLFVPLGCSALLSILFIYISNKIENSSKFRKKIDFTHIFPFFFLFFIFSLAIKKDVYLSSEILIQFLNIQWVIFGISIAVFGIWITGLMGRKNELLSKIDENKIRKEDKKSLEIQSERKFFANVHFSVFFLICNLFLLILSTSLFYIVFHGEANLITQSFAVSSCYLCTNSLVSIFIDVLSPVLFFKKKVKEVYELDKKKFDKQRIEKEAKKFLNEILSKERKKICDKEKNADTKKTNK